MLVCKVFTLKIAEAELQLESKQLLQELATQPSSVVLMCSKQNNFIYNMLEISLASTFLYSMLLGRREGVSKKSTLCTLVKMLKTMDDPSIYWDPEADSMS